MLTVCLTWLMNSLVYAMRLRGPVSLHLFIYIVYILLFPIVKLCLSTLQVLNVLQRPCVKTSKRINKYNYSSLPVLQYTCIYVCKHAYRHVHMCMSRNYCTQIKYFLFCFMALYPLLYYSFLGSCVYGSTDHNASIYVSLCNAQHLVGLKYSCCKKLMKIWITL